MLKNGTLRIGVVPIDDRPCNYNFFSEALKNRNDIMIDLPPKECLGHFDQVGNYSKLQSYLINHALHWDYLVLSIDALCYGGLVQAREYSEELLIDDYFERLAIIKIIKRINPNIKIYAYSVIIRLTTTVTKDQNVDQWEKIFKYSQLAYSSEHNPKLKPELLELERQIDSRLLKGYLNARKRNHVINLVAIDYVQFKLIDYLSLIQEDAQTEGIHLIEQTKLQEKIKELHLSDDIVLKNGTDELVCLLGSKILSNEWGRTKVYLETNQLSESYIGKYEDRPLLENIRIIFEEGGVDLVDDLTKADVVCYVINSDKEQKDFVFDSESISIQSASNIYSVKQRDPLKPFVVLDLQYVNGGLVSDLIDFMQKNKLSKYQLKGYSSWNTPSNAIGTVVLDCVLAKNNLTNNIYLYKRIVDDAIYQGAVRNELIRIAEKRKSNIWYLGKDCKFYEKYLNQMMSEEMSNYQNLLNSDTDFHFSFPWGRLFEIEIEGV